MFLKVPCNTAYFSNSFIPCALTEWNNLGNSIRELESISVFKSSLLHFIRPKASPIFGIMDPEGLKLLTRLRLNLSHLKEHKYCHNFADTLNPICNCGLLEVESTSHYLLRCSFFSEHRKILLNSIAAIRGDISNLSEKKMIDLFLYGDGKLSVEKNQAILKATIVFIKSSERFEVPLIT